MERQATTKFRAKLTDASLKQFRHVAQKLANNQLFCRYAISYGVASVLKSFNCMKEEQIEEIHKELMNECRRSANYFENTTFSKLGDPVATMRKIVSFMKLSKSNISHVPFHKKTDQELNEKLIKKNAPIAVIKRNTKYSREKNKQSKMKKYQEDTPFVPNLQEGINDEVYEDPNWKKRDISWVKDANVPPVVLSWMSAFNTMILL